MGGTVSKRKTPVLQMGVTGGSKKKSSGSGSILPEAPSGASPISKKQSRESRSSDSEDGIPDSDDEAAAAKEKDRPKPRTGIRLPGMMGGGGSKTKQETKPKKPPPAPHPPLSPATRKLIHGKIDSGCTTTIMNKKTMDRFKELAPPDDDVASVNSSAGSTYRFANGETKTALERTTVEAKVNGEPVYVTANVFESKKTPFLLGLNFLRRHNVTIEFGLEADRIHAPDLGLNGELLPRDKAGLSLMPFHQLYPHTKGKKAPVVE